MTAKEIIHGLFKETTPLEKMRFVTEGLIYLERRADEEEAVLKAARRLRDVKRDSPGANILIIESEFALADAANSLTS